MILFAVLVACTITAALHLPGKPYYNLDDAHNLFKEFVQKYGKVYSPEEHLARLEIFKESLKEINENNALHPLTEFGINHFADLTAEERQSYFGFMPLDDSFHRMAIKLDLPEEKITAPEEFDWRDKGVVTHVKNQRSCGSCWIFSATGNIEGQYAMKYKKLVAFSEQQSLDCIPPLDGNNNCDGGWPHMVMFYDAISVGAMPEEGYNYTARPSDCRENADKAVVHVDGLQFYMPTEESLQQLLIEKGPLSVALQATGIQRYTGGIIHPDSCVGDVNHAVLLVGYGVEKGVKYWSIKNSWGENWGEKGYFRLERGVNACAMGTSYTATCTVK